MNASAWRAISAFLWCIPQTALTSPTPSPVIWKSHQKGEYSQWLYHSCFEITEIKTHCKQNNYLSWHESFRNHSAKNKKKSVYDYRDEKEREIIEQVGTLTRGGHPHRQLERRDPSSQCCLLHKPSQCSSQPAQNPRY